MKTNVLIALKNLVESKNTNELIKFYKKNPNNRANNMGVALEFFVKDLFCSTLNVDDFNEKDKIYNEYLSYFGNNNNPPDFILKQSTAVEVKKIENISFGDIALNSSYPKDYLYSNSTLINNKCRHCEDEFGGWYKKDMLYVIGNVMKNKLKVLWFVDGSCYCADQNVYLNLKEMIHSGIEDISGINFQQTRELGKIKQVDNSGITNLRIRGMWNIEHPMKVFSDIIGEYDKDSNLYVYCLLLKDKYDLLPKSDKKELEIHNEVIIKDVKIKNPNDNGKLDAILIKIILN